MDKVFFIIDDIVNEYITAIDGTPLQTPVTASQMADSELGNWWVEKSARGPLVLVTYIPAFQDIYITIGSGPGSYDVYANSLVIDNKPIIVHPPHAPH